MYRRVFGVCFLAILNTACYSWATTAVPAPSGGSSIPGPLRIRLSDGDIVEFRAARVLGDSIAEIYCGASVAAGGRPICRRTERRAIALSTVVGMERQESSAAVRGMLLSVVVIGGVVLIVAGVQDFQRCGLYGCE